MNDKVTITLSVEQAKLFSYTIGSFFGNNHNLNIDVKELKIALDDFQMKLWNALRLNG
jgi:hypothetical protein